MQKIILLFSLVCLSTLLSAQVYTISGFVKEGVSEETLPGAVLSVGENNRFAISNNYGFYSLSLPGGHYIIYTSYAGMVTDTMQIQLDANITRNIFLRSPVSEEIIVAAKTDKNLEKEVQMSAHIVNINAVKEIPALLGEKDVLKVLQLLPGVQRGSEGSAGLFVRGGSSDQNLIILDDAIVYNASHLFGFMSVFDGDAIKNVELIKGGFPARYGGRLSSVVNVTMKDGNKESYHGNVSVGLISSKATFEGPINKSKSSFIVTARRSYADLIARPFMKKDFIGGYYFYDLTAKANFELDERNKLYISTYFGKDKYSAKTEQNNHWNKFNFLWGNATATVRWNHIYSPKTFSNLSLIYSNYNLKSLSTDKLDTFFYMAKYNSQIRDWSAKYDLEWYANPSHTVRTGIKATAHTFRPDAITVKHSTEALNAQDVMTFNYPEINAYAEDEWKANSVLALNIGMRVNAFHTNSKTYFNAEPRMSSRILLSRTSSVKVSYSMMNQYIHLLSHTGVGMATDLWVPSTDRLKPQQSNQFAAGFVKALPAKKLEITVEGYYKRMNHILNYREGASFLKITETDKIEKISFDENVITGKGIAYGAELMTEKKEGRFTGWVSFTLSWVKHSFDDIKGGAWFYPVYDRRHNLSIVGFYQLRPGIKLNALFSLASGNPIRIPTQGVFLPRIQFSGQILQYAEDFRDEVSNYSQRGQYRSEVYHRLDVGIQFSKKKRRGERMWEISIYNVYNRQNPFFYSAESEDELNYGIVNKAYKLYKYTVFPLIPSVSYNYKF